MLPWQIALQTWFVSGEALHRELAILFKSRVASGTQLVNLYGSTEVRQFWKFLELAIRATASAQCMPQGLEELVGCGVRKGQTSTSITSSDLRSCTLLQKCTC